MATEPLKCASWDGGTDSSSILFIYLNLNSFLWLVVPILNSIAPEGAMGQCTSVVIDPVYSQVNICMQTLIQH